MAEQLSLWDLAEETPGERALPMAWSRRPANATLDASSRGGCSAGWHRVLLGADRRPRPALIPRYRDRFWASAGLQGSSPCAATSPWWSTFLACAVRSFAYAVPASFDEKRCWRHRTVSFHRRMVAGYVRYARLRAGWSCRAAPAPERVLPGALRARRARLFGPVSAQPAFGCRANTLSGR